MLKFLVVSLAIGVLCSSAWAQETLSLEDSVSLEDSARLALLAMPQASKVLDAIKPETLEMDEGLRTFLLANLNRAKRRVRSIPVIAERVVERPTVMQVHHLMESVDRLDLELGVILRLLPNRVESEVFRPLMATYQSVSSADSALFFSGDKFLNDADVRLQGCEPNKKPDGGV